MRHFSFILIVFLLFTAFSLKSQERYGFNYEYSALALWDAATFSIISGEILYENPGNYTPVEDGSHLTRVPPILSYYIDGADNYGNFRLDYVWGFITSFMFNPKGPDNYGFDHSIVRAMYGKYFFGKMRDLPVKIGLGLDADVRASYAITSQNLDGTYEHKSYAAVGLGPNAQIRLNPFRWLNITPSVSHVFYFLPKYGSSKFIKGSITTFAVPVYFPLFKSKNSTSGSGWGLFLRPEITTGTMDQIGAGPQYLRKLDISSSGLNIGVAYRKF